MKRKICVITGSRAEYDLLKPLMEEIKEDKELELQLVATGMHLSREFGLTYKRIEEDSFRINKKIDINLNSDTPLDISKSIGCSVSGFAKGLGELKPDIVVLLGDRFELMGPALAALVQRIPLAHIHGGERTEGAFDDAIRNSITKMSHLHFTSTEEYRKRVIQLGEEPGRVFNVGSLGVGNIKALKLLSKKELEKAISFKLARRNLLVTFHPVTLEINTSKKQFNNLLQAIDGLQETHIIFTKANADTDGRIINTMIDEYVRKNPQRSRAFDAMGQLLYFSAMRLTDAVLGNSSSGIIEAPSFKIGTINIGDRQRGRMRAGSVIDCAPTKEDIEHAIRKVYSEPFKAKLNTGVNPYGGTGTAKKIKSILKRHNISNITKKEFYNIKFNHGGK